MAEITKQALKVDNSQSFPNNNNGAITPSILRAFNVNIIDSLVDEIGYNQDSASWNQAIDSLEGFTGSLATAFVSTASFNQYTSSTNGRLNNLESTTASLNSSVTQLNANTASQQVSINALNTFTASQSTASIVTSISNLNQATASLFGSASVALVTASFNNSNRNLTFTKGDNQTFSVNIPDISGSAGDFVTTASFNSYTGSNDQRVTSLETNSASVNVSITNINQTTGSLNTSISNLNTFTASQSTASIVTSITNLNQATASLFGSASLGLVTASVNVNIITFTKGNGTTFDVAVVASGSVLPGTITGSAQITALGFVSSSVTASSLVTASFDTGTRNLTFTKGDATTFNVNIPDVSGSAGNFVTTASFNAYTQSNDQRVTSLETTSGSVTTSITALNQFTASQSTASIVNSITELNAFTQSAAVSITNLNLSSGSQQVSIDALNTFTASQSTASIVNSITELNTFSASALISISNINQTTASLNTSVTNLNQFTASATESVVTAIVTNNGSNYYIIDGIDQPKLSFVPGPKYRFDLSGIAGNHPFKFATSPNGPTQYTTGVTSGSGFIQIEVGYNTTTPLYYYCTNHSGMGNEINVLAIDKLVTTASFNAYTSSNDQKVNSLETNTGSVNTSITNINSTTASLNTSISNLNAFTASQSTASIVTSISNLNAFSASAITSITDLNQATSSLFGSASLGLTTASFDNATRNLTFTKGDASTFNVNIPAVSGSAGATLGANTFTGSQTVSSSLNVSGSANFVGGDVNFTDQNRNINIDVDRTVIKGQKTTLISSSLDISGSLTASLANGFTYVGNSSNISTLVATSSFGSSINTGSFMVTGSVSGNVLQFTKGDATTFNLTVATGSGGGAAFPFVGDAQISGSLGITGSAFGNVVALSITSNTASMDLSLGNYFTLTLAGTATTHISASNVQPGVSATLVITTGTNSSASLAPTMLQPSGSAYSATNGSSKKDVLSIVAVTTGVPFVVSTKNMI